MMMKFEVGYIFTRIFLQKTIEVNDNILIEPIGNTGNKGFITDVEKKLVETGFYVTKSFLEKAFSNFAKTGKTVLVTYREIEASTAIGAIEQKESEVEKIINTLSVLSLNPPQFMAAFAKTEKEGEVVNFYIPNDPIIRHATNVPGFLDAVHDLIEKSLKDDKLALLIRLFKSALEQTLWINKVLYLLILFEEASDNEKGVLADRIRSHAEKYGYIGDMEIIARELGIVFPEGKSVVDMIVKLRNSAAHNGTITENTLMQYNGEWIIPIFKDKDRFTRLMIECARYLLITLVGHSREKKAMKLTGSIELKFD